MSGLKDVRHPACQADEKQKEENHPGGFGVCFLKVYSISTAQMDVKSAGKRVFLPKAKSGDPRSQELPEQERVGQV